MSKLLGHSSVKVTEKSYAFLDMEKVAAEVAAQKPAHRPTDSKPERKKINKMKVRTNGL